MYSECGDHPHSCPRLGRAPGWASSSCPRQTQWTTPREVNALCVWCLVLEQRHLWEAVPEGKVQPERINTSVTGVILSASLRVSLLPSHGRWMISVSCRLMSCVFVKLHHLYRLETASQCSEPEHLSRCFRDVCVSSSVNCLFVSFAFFSLRSWCFYSWFLEAL